LTHDAGRKRQPTGLISLNCQPHTVSILPPGRAPWTGWDRTGENRRDFHHEENGSS
jgi:hypothetical protein